MSNGNTGPFDTSDEPFDRHMNELVAYLDDMLGETRDHSPLAYRSGFEYARHLVRDYHLTYSEAIECDCEDNMGFYEEMAGGSWVCAECGVTVLDDDDPFAFEPPDEGEIQPDHPFNQEQTLYSEEFSVEFVPTKDAFTLRVFDDEGIYHLVGRASIEDYLDSIEKSSVPDGFINAIKTGANMISSAAIGDVIGPDAIRSLNEGSISREEFMEEFSRKVDRSIQRDSDDE